MYFTTDSLLPEKQQPLIIAAAPYGLEWLTRDYAEETAVSWDAQVQKAVDCYNAGATLLHVPVRNPKTGRGSKSFKELNDMIGHLRNAVPKMVLQISGSISYGSFDHSEAKWMGYETRHILTELDPKPDQITIVIGSTRMNILSLTGADDIVGARLQTPGRRAAYRKMVADTTPEFYIEHLKRLRANDIQPFFMWTHTNNLKEAEHLIRTGLYMGPLNHNLMATGGRGAAASNPFDFRGYVRQSPQGSVPFIESWMRTVPQFGIMAIALGIHVRVGIEGNLRNKKGVCMTSVEQVEQMVGISEELGRKVATPDEARKILKIGIWHNSVDETLASLGLLPNWEGSQLGVFVKRSDENLKCALAEFDRHVMAVQSVARGKSQLTEKSW